MDELASEDHRSVVDKGPQKTLRYLFFLFVIRPVMLIVMGMNVRHRGRLPKQGPAIIVANHNSHLDTLAVMTMFGMDRLHLVRPVAAADYFLKTKSMAWFSVRVLGIVPLEREVRSHRRHPLEPINEALDKGQIVLLFPEGTRGQPELRQPMQVGIAHLAKRHAKVPIVPIFMHGLGKALPRGEGLLVPFICDVFVGEAIYWTGEKSSFMEKMAQAFDTLETEANKPLYVQGEA